MHRIATAIIILVLTLGIGSATLISTHMVAAQTIPGISQPIEMSMIPDIPRPNENFSVSIQSYSLDLDSALIVWSIDGKEVQKGVGLKTLSATAGSVGSMSSISVAVTTSSMGTFTQSVIVRPADVALMWESDTYTPPFYKGKALHSYNGSFKVIALPEFIGIDGRRIDPHELVYTWSKNGEVQADASGYGKTTFISSQTSYLRSGEDISVEVSAPRDNIVAKRSITISPTVPKVVFYEDSPLYGPVYEKSLPSSFTLKNEEISVLAEPYFFSVPARNSTNLTYTWKLNGSTISSSQNKSDITLRKTGESGASSISLTVQNLVKLLQGGNNSVVIRYE